MKKKRKIRLIHRRYPQNHLDNIYEYLQKYQEKHGFMPSTYEVARRFHTRHSSVGYWYGLMEEKGMITRNKGMARAIVLLKQVQTTEAT